MNNRCKRCNRELSDPNADYGWRCAQILGVSNQLSKMRPEAFERFLSGISKADKLMGNADFNSEQKNGMYKSYAKMALWDGIDKNKVAEAKKDSFAAAGGRKSNTNLAEELSVWDKLANTVKKLTGFNRTDKEKYGENSKIYIALANLNESREAFPECEEQIKQLEKEVRAIGDMWGSRVIDGGVSLILLDERAKNLSTVEQVLSLAHPFKALIINEARDFADEKTLEIYNQKGEGLDAANAFKHICWSAYATNKIGAKYTKLFTDAHELGWGGENANNPEAMKMDFFNNERGRVLGEKYSIKVLPRIIAHDIAMGNAAVIRNEKSVLSTPEWRRKDEIKKE